MSEKKHHHKLPISAVIVVYNEEKIIERALQSFYDLVDEIIVVHDGKCTDRTLEIAKYYTDKIFELEHIGEAERHRPFTYEKAKNDWILQVDADEYLSGDLRNNLEDMIKEDVDIYELSWSTFYSNIHYFWFYKRALFRKSLVYFIGVSHEAVMPINKKVVVGKSKFALMHEPLYDNLTLAVFRKKWKTWAKIQAKQYLDDFSLIPKWNCQLSDWDYRRKISINHPIIFGLVGMTLYNSFGTLKNFIMHPKFLLLKAGILGIFYHFYLYLYLYKLKNNKQAIQS